MKPRRWAAAAPREDTRELGTAEGLTSQAHMLGALMAGGMLKISGPLTPELVRRGLDWLQAEHPMLRAHIVRKGIQIGTAPFQVKPRAFFETSGTAPIPLRSVIDAGRRAGWRVFQEEMRKAIPVGPLPRIKAALIRASEHADIAELIICIDHTIADAQSAMFAIGQLLAFLADPDGAPEPRGRQLPLPPSLDAALTPKSDNGRPYEPMIRLPLARLHKTATGTDVERRQFTRAETDAIKTAVKTHHVTLHGLATAAILKGIHARFGIREMTVLSSVDVRRQCRPPISAATFGCYIDLLRTRHRIDETLWDLSTDVTFRLITTLARDQKSASVLRPPDWPMLKAELVPLLRNRLRGDGLVITTAGDINLRRRYGPFVLEDMTGLISQEVIGAGFFAMVLEREGELEVSLCYAPHCLNREDAAAVADQTASALRTVDRPRP